MSTLPDSPSAPGSPDAPDHKLKRTLGLWQLTLLGVSTQIGSGWLFAVLSSASVAGPAAILSWILGAGLFIVVSLTWIELGTCSRDRVGSCAIRRSLTVHSPGGSPAGDTGSGPSACPPSKRRPS